MFRYVPRSYTAPAKSYQVLLGCSVEFSEIKNLEKSSKSATDFLMILDGILNIFDLKKFTEQPGTTWNYLEPTVKINLRPWNNYFQGRKLIFNVGSRLFQVVPGCFVKFSQTKNIQKYHEKSSKSGIDFDDFG